MKAQFLGRIGDFGLGTPGKITSALSSDQEITDYAQAVSECLVANEDPSSVGCIDGRRVLTRADGSAYKAVARAAGGTFATDIMAAVSEAAIAKSIESDDPQDAFDALESELAAFGGVSGKCSHTGGCAACKQAPTALRAMALPPVQKTTEALMGIDQVRSVLGVNHDTDAAERVVQSAPRIADWLEKYNWDGNEYTSRAIKSYPYGVEDLQIDDQHEFQGHREHAIVIVADRELVVSEQKLAERGLGDAFILTLGKLSSDAEILSGGELNDRTRAVIAGLSWNLGVANTLCDPSMPVLLISK